MPSPDDANYLEYLRREQSELAFAHAKLGEHTKRLNEGAAELAVTRAKLAECEAEREETQAVLDNVMSTARAAIERLGLSTAPDAGSLRQDEAWGYVAIFEREIEAVRTRATRDETALAAMTAAHTHEVGERNRLADELGATTAKYDALAAEVRAWSDWVIAQDSLTNAPTNITIRDKYNTAKKLLLSATKATDALKALERGHAAGEGVGNG